MTCLVMRRGLCVLASMLLVAAARAQGVVYACADDAGFPPYSYLDGDGKEKVTGFTVELVAELLKARGLRVHIDSLPWKRCVAEVEAGRRYALVLDATYSDERAAKYWLSEPLYEIHSAMYYDPKRFPEPPRFVTASEMRNYRYCGIAGYNYSMYKMPAEQWELSAKDEVARFRMLRAGRCDFAIADLEPLNGFVRLRKLDLSGLAHVPVPEFSAKKYYLLISRGPAGGEALRQQLNASLQQMRASGQYKRLLARWGVTP